MGRKTGIEKVEGNTIVVKDVDAFSNHLKKTSEALTRKVKILKAKIKDELFLEGKISEELPGHSKKTSTFECTVPVHDDLKAAFAKLTAHLAVICSQLKVKRSESLLELDVQKFEVRGFTISGHDENEGVTINGCMEGTYGIVNLNSPLTKWDDADYPFVSELAEDVQAAVYEVEQYLFEGKRAPERQLEMDFGDGEEEGEGDQE